MTPAARVQAAIEILDAIIVSARDNGPPADAIIADWFRQRRYAGSKDRAAVRDIVWTVVRAFGAPPPSGRAGVLNLPGGDHAAAFDGSGYGPATVTPEDAEIAALPFPDWFDPAALDWITEAEAVAMIARAPLDIRVNTLRATPDEARDAFPEAVPIPNLPNALRLPEMPGLQQHPLFEAGKIEVQDAGSQHVVRIAAAQPGETVIDLCAGGGGKTLGLAAAMQGEGRLIACDTVRNRLAALTPRAQRAVAMSVETRLLDPNKETAALAELTGQADLVLIDAPCSGSGTWRRSPDLRWRMNPARLARIEALQAHILNYAQTLVKPGGRLVYAVCSIRDEEGADQVGRLGTGWRANDLGDIGRPRGQGRLLTPHHDGTDGFFVASLSKA